MSEKTKEAEVWKIKRTKETEDIFDSYLHMLITREKATKMLDEMNLLEKRLDFERTNMWTQIEKHLGLFGKDVGLNLDKEKSNGEEIVVYRQDGAKAMSSNSGLDIVRRLLGMN